MWMPMYYVHSLHLPYLSNSSNYLGLCCLVPVEDLALNCYFLKSPLGFYFSGDGSTVSLLLPGTDMNWKWLCPWEPLFLLVCVSHSLFSSFAKNGIRPGLSAFPLCVPKCDNVLQFQNGINERQFEKTACSGQLREQPFISKKKGKKVQNAADRAFCSPVLKLNGEGGWSLSPVQGQTWKEVWRELKLCMSAYKLSFNLLK